MSRDPLRTRFDVDPDYNLRDAIALPEGAAAQEVIRINSEEELLHHFGHPQTDAELEQSVQESMNRLPSVVPVENFVPQQGWKVYLRDRVLDIVYFDADMDRDAVYDALVGHDGYPAGIFITPDKSEGKP